MANDNGFEALGLRAELLAVIGELGYEAPTPIQIEAIPPLLLGRDLLGQAATGTGKTAAFALPILQRFVPEGDRAKPFALVLVPTRELAVQVAEAVYRYGRGLGIRVLPVFGGQPIGHQLRALHRGVDVVVATPGRALDHLDRRTLDLSGLQTVVLDEADQMLDMGFAEDIEALLLAAPQPRQTVLFSATLPHRILNIAERQLKNPFRVQLGHAKAPEGSPEKTRQVVYVVPREHKVSALCRLLDVESPTAGIVFCRTRVEVDTVADALGTRGYRADALHGGLSQDHRDRVMHRLRTGVTDLVIATDVAARGLDVEHLTHVVNFDVPVSPDDYVHRIGRVGRAGREGVALTLAEPREQRAVKNIERMLKKRLQMARLPTVADLRAKRLEFTRVALQEAMAGTDLERFRAVVEALSAEHDVVDIAAAAIKLVHEANGGDGDENELDERGPREQRPRREDGPPPTGGTVRLFVGLGRMAGIRPVDLVGAISNEAGIDGGAVGSIQIGDRFSLVDVPEELAETVIRALRNTTLRGRKPSVRRDRGH